MNTNFLKTLKVTFVVGVFFIFSPVNAYQIKDLKTVDRDDFVLSPSKVEVILDPGTSVTRNIEITNRTGDTKRFLVETEDFTGSKDPSRSIVLLGDEKGPHSLKDYIKPEIFSFTLNPGQQMVLPVSISIPKESAPGGYYSSILVTTFSGAASGGGAVTASRLGALFFVRVNGEAKEDGKLENFKLIGDKNIFWSGKPSGFELVFKNDGNVHLAPSGLIEVKNIFGISVSEIEVDPYFVMPDSVRYREVRWQKDMIFGRYSAVASIDRGYGKIVDQEKISFWIVPIKTTALIFISIVFLLLVIRFIGRNFKFEVGLKKKE